jgi:hypothetical protein
MHRWLARGFRVREGFTLPVRWLPFAANLYYFAVAEKLSTTEGTEDRRSHRVPDRSSVSSVVES